MVKIRLMRMGTKKVPFYRVVVAEVSSPRNGRFVENLGYYNPVKDPQIVELNRERVLYWLEKGAQPTDTAKSLFRQQGILKALHEPQSGEAAAEEAPDSDEA